MSSPGYKAYRESGVEWLGKVPAHWTVHRIGELFSEVSEPGSDDLPVLSVSIHSGVSDSEIDPDDMDRKVTRSDDRTKYKRVRPSDLVYNMMRAWQGGFGTVQVEGMVSPAYVVARPKIGKHAEFVEALLRTPPAVEEMRRYSKGVTDFRLRLYWDEFKSLRVCLPSPDEFEAIAAFLDRETGKIDALVEEQRRLIELLREKRQAVISHAVTKGLDPTAPMKDSGVEWLGEVPAHWTVTALKREWAVTDCKHITAEFVEDGVPLASIREVQSRFVDLTEAKQTTQIFFDQLIEGGREPATGDLIFSRNATVGEIAEVADWHPPFAMGQDVCLLRKSRADLSSAFLLDVVRSRIVVEQLANVMVGSTFKRVNVEEIRNLVVPFPPAPEQEDIARFVEQRASNFDTLVIEAEAAITLLQERRSALISAAVTGKIDVRVGVSAEAKAA